MKCCFCHLKQGDQAHSRLIITILLFCFLVKAIYYATVFLRLERLRPCHLSGFETRQLRLSPGRTLEHSIHLLHLSMDSSINYGMDDDAYDDFQGAEQLTSTQQDPQSQMITHRWGYLQPCNASLTRIDFWKIYPKYTIGRGQTELTQIILPGLKVSE